MLPGRVVVAAVDDSPDSQAAVNWLQQNFVRGGSLKLLMCAVDQPSFYSGAPAAPAASSVEAAKEACRKRFGHVQDAEVVVAHGGSSEAIGQAILGRAQELRATMLAIAPHTRTAKERVLQGSVTDYCCRHSRLPVLVVRGVVGGGEREA